MDKLNELETLIEIMKKLRSENGCPWDKEQTIDSLKPFLIEEAYEVLDAMDESPDKLKDELGDLLLQIVFQSQIMSENNKFKIQDVIESINKKMIRRHPHVFSNEIAKDSNEVLLIWEKIKKKEKSSEDRKSILDGIPKHIPAILRAYKIQNKAAKVGFDWENVDDAIDKMYEEIEEMQEEIRNNEKEKIEDEIGDVIFSVINVARKIGIDPYKSLLKTINKFDKRFKYIESKLDINKATLEEMDKLWEESKNEIR